MTVKELKSYLDRFVDSEEVRFIAADTKNRIGWANYQIGIICITDASAPAICLKLGESESFDEDMIQAAGEDERNSKWILVGEKLPEPCKWVMATVKSHLWISDYENQTIQDDEKVEHPETTFTTLARYGKKGLWQYMDPDVETMILANYVDTEDLSSPREEVIAWMTLPEPYKAVN